MYARLSTDRAALETKLNAVHADASALRQYVAQLHGETMTKLAGLSERHGEYSAAQAESAELIKARLAKLTGLARRGFLAILRGTDAPDRKSVVKGKSVSVRVDLGGRSIFTKKQKLTKKT